MKPAVVVAVVLGACGSKSTREEPVQGVTPVETAERGDAAPAGTDVAVVADAGANVDAVATVEAPLPAVAVNVPTKAAELQKWLVAAHYKAWQHESKPHVSEGPHGDAVKTFISPSLAASLTAKADSHPEGAAAVKELYDDKGTHTGWAVSVKTARDSGGGKRWYWYEVFSTAANAKAAYQGVGVKLCRECHADGGSDQVLISFPLQ